MTDKQCKRCGEVNPAEIHTCTPKQEEGCAGCGKKASEGWALYCVKCIETVQEPIGWIYEDDEGRITFSQMPQNPPFWEPVYREKNNKGIE